MLEVYLIDRLKKIILDVLSICKMNIKNLPSIQLYFMSMVN